MQPRSRRRLWLGLGGLLAALLAAAAFVAAAWMAGPRVISHSPADATRDTTPRVALELANAGGVNLRSVRVTLDGRRLAGGAITRDGDELVVDTGRLAEGTHDIRVTTGPVGLLRRRIDERWSFRIDTTAPQLRVLNPRGTAARSDVRNTRFSVRAEAGSTLAFTSRAGTVEATVGDSGRARVLVPLAEGRQQVDVVARDSVGNESRAAVHVFVDSITPVLAFRMPERLDTAQLDSLVTASDANGVTVTARVDRREEDVQVRRTGRRTFALSRGEKLAEGIHRIAVTATDPFGNTTSVTRVVLVDSSEKLGTNAIGRGARGADVRQLHAELRRLGLFRPGSGDGRAAREWRQQRFGPATAAAVGAFQRDKGLADDGVAGEDTLAAMTLKIVIDRASHTLTLYRLGRIDRTYRVAVGSARYPTPAGEFEIVDMQKNPTWNPPDSDWAKGEKPIPPGPDNPLGTRWMGLSVPAVGIHGTNNPASLGYSVSHGCIRMAIPDVEELFGIVRVGTPVVIR